MRSIFLILMLGSALARGQDDPFAPLRDFVKSNCGLECIECVAVESPGHALTADGVPLRVARLYRDAGREFEEEMRSYADMIDDWRAGIEEEMEWCEADDDCDPQSENMVAWREEQEAIVAGMVEKSHEMLAQTADSNSNQLLSAVEKAVETYRQCGGLD